MIAIDTNILLPLVDQDHSQHDRAMAFAASLAHRSDVAVSEFHLLELYNLLRNVAVVTVPLSASEAVEVCEAFRRHPSWQVIGFPPDSRRFHDQFWPRLRQRNFARRRSYDWRTALSILQAGVSEFATVNVRDFEGFGFERVWNPLQTSDS